MVHFHLVQYFIIEIGLKLNSIKFQELISSSFNNSPRIACCHLYHSVDGIASWSVIYQFRLKQLFGHENLIFIS